MTLYIKNMVSIPCKVVVKAELEKMNLHIQSLEYGQVEVEESLTKEQLTSLGSALTEMGLELIGDKKAVLLEKIKNVIVDVARHRDEPLKENFSVYLGEKLKYDYRYLANLFASEMGMTIENYMIIHKIERVKELLIYDEFSLSEISYKLNYSSVAHLSNQFKKYTGLTPTLYRGLQLEKEKNNQAIPTT